MSANVDANFFENHREKLDGFLTGEVEFSFVDAGLFCDSLREQADANGYDPFNALKHLFCVVMLEQRGERTVKEAIIVGSQ